MENAQLASAEPTKVCKTSLTGVISTLGTKSAASASSHIKVEETLMPSTTTQMAPLMSESGKLTTSIGVNAAKEKPPAIPKSTSAAPSSCINGEETALSSGKPTLPVDADLLFNIYQV